MTNAHLAGRSAFVTGSVSGIGLAIAKSLGAAGARVALHSLASEKEASVAERAILEAGAPGARFFEGDLREVKAIEKLMERLGEWDDIDVLVNNAGMQHTISLAEATSDIWDNIIAVNLSAAFHTMRHIMPGMAERGFGRVVNISSVHGLVASPDKAPYVASKFGLIGLSKVAALEYAQSGSAATGGVTVNCICPGWVETALVEPQVQEHARQAGGDREAGIEAMLSAKQPTQRMTDPSEIGDVAAWLCHRSTHNITGTTVPVDGGWTAQ